MMTGDVPRSNPTVQIPSYDSHYMEIPPLNNDYDYESVLGDGGRLEDYDASVDAFSCDNFRMFGFKVKKCAIIRSHDWTECPFSHPGEKARRRDPRRYHYSGIPCPNFRNGGCARGDACEYAHGVFECWLHPSRYRTLPCKDGTLCRRRVCFFAHTPAQLRVLPSLSTEESRAVGHVVASSPRSTLYSPYPLSPTTESPPVSPGSVSQISESMRRLRLSKMKMGMRLSVPPAIRRGIMNLPATPNRRRGWMGLRDVDGGEEEPVMERVESGRELREKIYEKLGKENSLKRVNSVSEAGLHIE